MFVSDEAMQDEPDGTKPKKSEEKKPVKAALISPEALETLENHSGSLGQFMSTLLGHFILSSL